MVYHLVSDNQLVSGSEDGTVRLWDFRQSAATSIIKPYENPKLNRPELGKWVGAASLSDDWLVSRCTRAALLQFLIVSSNQLSEI